MAKETTGRFKLFGKIIDAAEDEAMKKSKSTGNLVNCNGEHGRDAGYVSDSLLRSHQQRTKGLPWTEGEHRAFLAGLEELGKGDWKGISRNYVRTRTPTQVASHAQKFFLRLSSADKTKHRSPSLFDVMSSHDVIQPTSPVTLAHKISHHQGYESPVRLFGHPIQYMARGEIISGSGDGIFSTSPAGEMMNNNNKAQPKIYLASLLGLQGRGGSSSKAAAAVVSGPGDPAKKDGGVKLRIGVA